MNSKNPVLTVKVDVRTVLDLLKKNAVSYKVIGSYDVFLKCLSPFTISSESALTWTKSNNLKDLPYSSIVIAADSVNIPSHLNSSLLLITPNSPKAIYTLIVLNLIRQNLVRTHLGVSAIEVMSSSFETNPSYPMASVSINSTIGKDVSIHPGAIIYPNCVIENNCSIGANSVIGAQGFGLVQLPNNNLRTRVPHLGGVHIDSNSHVGNNCCIDSGMYIPTTIASGIYIDNLVHVAHNCTIGHSSTLLAGSVLCGSVITSENVWLAPNSVVLQQLRIGSNTTIGAGCVITRNIGSDQTLYVSPPSSL